MALEIEIRFREISNLAPSSRLVERDSQLKRLVGAISHSRHTLVAGPAGVGKTLLIMSGLAGAQSQVPVYQFQLQTIVPALVSGERLLPIIRAVRSVAAQLPSARLLIEDLQMLGLEDPLRFEIAIQLLLPFLEQPKLQVIASLQLSSILKRYLKEPFFAQHFEIVEISEPTDIQAEAMVASHDGEFGSSLEVSTLTEAVRLARRYGQRSLPDSAIRLLQQAADRGKLAQRSTLRLADLHEVLADQTNIPFAELTKTEEHKLRELANELQCRVIGQPATEKIVATIQRARLGLADSRRPRASFLLLGPSGVGKTETAKVLSQLIFGSFDKMIRLDMTEFSEAHMVARLVGAPPGYVGYEQGGQLTGPIQHEPYSLILLDELEKAHVRVHDLFLQVLDDGRLTDTSGASVDFSQTIILATSNVATQAIVGAFEQGRDLQDPIFFEQVILPLLLQTFRPEFINRFDGVAIFEPLGERALVGIAQLMLAQLAQRLVERKIRFAVADDQLCAWLSMSRNPLLGARPVRRMIRERFEVPLARYLLERPDAKDFTITGEEAWIA